MRTRGVTRLVPLLLSLMGLVVGLVATAQAADREKLLSDPGVFGPFAVFAVNDAW